MVACLFCHFVLRCALFGQASSNVCENQFSTCFICSDTANKKMDYEQMFSHSDDSPHTPVSALNLIL